MNGECSSKDSHPSSSTSLVRESSLRGGIAQGDTAVCTGTNCSVLANNLLRLANNASQLELVALCVHRKEEKSVCAEQLRPWFAKVLEPLECVRECVSGATSCRTGQHAARACKCSPHTTSCPLRTSLSSSLPSRRRFLSAGKLRFQERARQSKAKQSRAERALVGTRRLSAVLLVLARCS